MIEFLKRLITKSEDQVKIEKLQLEVNTLKRIIQDLEIENSDFEICKVNLLEENRELKNQIKELNLDLEKKKLYSNLQLLANQVL